VMSGYGEVQRTHDATQLFEQEANFWYITGIEAPDWWVILDGSSGAQWLVSPDLSEAQQVFDGGLSVAEAKRVSGVKTVFSRDEALVQLRHLAKRHSIVYTTEQPKYLREHAHFQLNGAQLELKKTLERIFQQVQLCNRELATLRTIKQPVEIAAIKKAVDLTIRSFEAVKPQLLKAKFEYELEATMTQVIRGGGAWGHAYSPIVAQGANACTLHYALNNDHLERRNLVLFDVGARYQGYAADISRTYALSSKPSKRQVAVHEAVVEAQAACIRLLKPGLAFETYETEVKRIMKQALETIGLSTERYREYFPHAVGHGLGVDVHDTMAGYDSFQVGMVVTVEPGIYIREEGLGVRIEDDIVITETGHKNLSSRLSTALS